MVKRTVLPRDIYFEIDRHTHSLYYQDGWLDIDRQDVMVLEVLFDNAGEIVPRERTIAAVWTSEGALSYYDNNLSTAIARIRNVLEVYDPDNTIVHLLTLKKRGHRLIIRGGALRERIGTISNTEGSSYQALPESPDITARNSNADSSAGPSATLSRINIPEEVAESTQETSDSSHYSVQHPQSQAARVGIVHGPHLANSLRDATLDILRLWAENLNLTQSAFDGIFLFGSLVNKGGRHFTPKSDVDLLLRLDQNTCTPSEIVQACESLLDKKRQLEASLSAVWQHAASAPRASIVVVTDFDLEFDVHKDGKASFYFDNDFLSLASGAHIPGPLANDEGPLLTRQPVYLRPLDVAKLSQKYRNEFLAVGPDDECGLKEWNDIEDPADPLPKPIMRSAASVRYFAQNLKDKSSFDLTVGLEYIHDLVKHWQPTGGDYASLAEWLSDRRGARGNRLAPLPPSRHLLLWEILAHTCRGAVRERLMRQPPHVGPFTEVAPIMASEADFVALASGPSLKLGSLDLQCKLFPTNLWGQNSLETYVDDPEEQRKVELLWVSSELPSNLLSNLLAEIADSQLTVGKNKRSFPVQNMSDTSIENLRDTYQRLKQEGSNAYPRLAGNPTIVPDEYRSVLQVPIGPSNYGVSLIRERRLDLPSVQALASRHILNSLAVRVAYTYKDERGARWIEFQQRQERSNATYSGAWDVSAAGYIDPQKHEDPRVAGRVSPWQACASELAEELQIPIELLPHRDNYRFFGVGVNDPTGQVDLLAYCLGSYIPNPNRRKSPLVKAYGRCLLEPEAVAEFVLHKRYWVPSAMLVLILTLEIECHYSRRRVEQAFQICADALSFKP